MAEAMTDGGAHVHKDYFCLIKFITYCFNLKGLNIYFLYFFLVIFSTLISFATILKMIQHAEEFCEQSEECCVADLLRLTSAYQTTLRLKCFLFIKNIVETFNGGEPHTYQLFITI